MDNKWNETRAYIYSVLALKEQIDSLPWSKTSDDYCSWEFYSVPKLGSCTIGAYLSEINPIEMEGNNTPKLLPVNDGVVQVSTTIQWLVIELLYVEGHEELKEEFIKTLGNEKLIIPLEGMDGVSKASEMVEILREYLISKPVN